MLLLVILALFFVSGFLLALSAGKKVQEIYWWRSWKQDSAEKSIRNPYPAIAPRWLLGAARFAYAAQRGLLSGLDWPKVRTLLSFLPEFPLAHPGEWLAYLQCLAALGALGAGLIFLNWEAAFLGAMLLPLLAHANLVHQVRLRKKKIVSESPELFELLASCMEAGLSLEQSIEIIYAEGLGQSAVQEMHEVTKRIEMGATREEALGYLAARLDHPQIHRFVATFLQAVALGTPIAKILRQQSDELRQTLIQAAEKRSYEAPIKIIFPLIIFIFPVVFVILLGPIVVRLMRGF
jgi:Flp pilus assembly protein TadB